jgi:hypothetical protein
VADIEITYDPISVSNGPVSVTVDGLDNIKVDATLATPQPVKTDSTFTLATPQPVKTDSTFTFATPQPVKTDSTFTFATPQPLKAESRSAIDLQPVVVDQCLRLSLGPLPPTQVCLPNRQHVGLTLFGIEVFGLTLEGEARIVVCDLPTPPHVVRVAAPEPRGFEAARHHHPDHPDAGPPPGEHRASEPFVVRLAR